MSKVINILVFTLVTLLLLRFTGVIENSGGFLSELDLTNPNNFASTDFWNKMFTVGSISAVGAVGAALAGLSLDVVIFFGVLILVAPTLFNLVKDLFILSSQLAQIHPALGALVISPLLFMALISLIDWYRNKAD